MNEAAVVVGLEDGVAPASRYAELRQLPVRHVADLTTLYEVLQASTVPVILSLGEKLRISDFSQIVRLAHDERIAIGFIDGWRGVDSAVEHAVALSKWCPISAPGVTIWSSDLGTFGDMGECGDIDIVPHSDTRPYARLSKSRRTLGMIGHGNGIDAPLGDDVLCGIADMLGNPGLQKYLPCGQGGRCIRAREVDGNLITPNRISTRTLGGDVIVWATCYGVLNSDSIFDPRGGMLAGFLDSTRPRQVITLSRSVRVEYVSVLAACLQIESGTPFGEVVSGLNLAHQASGVAGSDPPWLLIGDPTARVHHNPSVALVENTADVKLGAGLIRVTGSPKPEVLLLQPTVDIERTPSISARLVPGSELGVWVRRDSGSPIRVLQGQPYKEQTLAIRRMWSSLDRLTFTNLFFRLAELNMLSVSFVYPENLAMEIASEIDRLSSIDMSLDPIGTLSGLVSDFESAIDDEVSTWATLNQHIHELITEFVTSVGGVLDHIYGFMHPSMAESRREICLYCGCPSERLVYRIRGAVSPRAVIKCSRCTVISDTDFDLGSVRIFGPEVATAGRAVEFSLNLERWPTSGIQFGVGSIVAQRVPWNFFDHSSLATIEWASTRQDMTVTWKPPADLAPGQYFILAPVVTDGAISVARRPMRLITV